MAFTYIIKGNLVKEVLIGVTNDLEKEIKNLNRTKDKSFVSFEAYAVYEMPDGADQDYIYRIINSLDCDRINNYHKDNKVGLYNISLKNACGILRYIAEVTETKDRFHWTTRDGSGYIELGPDFEEPIAEKTKERNEKNKLPKSNNDKKAPKFTFAELGIPEGAEIHLKGDPSVTAVVTKKNKVIFNGESNYLSPVTRDLLDLKTSPRGPDYWTYGENDETLTQIRERLKKDSDEE